MNKGGREREIEEGGVEIVRVVRIEIVRCGAE